MTLPYGETNFWRAVILSASFWLLLTGTCNCNNRKKKALQSWNLVAIFGQQELLNLLVDMLSFIVTLWSLILVDCLTWWSSHCSSEEDAFLLLSFFHSLKAALFSIKSEVTTSVDLFLLVVDWKSWSNKIIIIIEFLLNNKTLKEE